MVKPGSIIDKETYLKKSKGARKKAKSCKKSKQTKLWNIQSKRQNEKKGSTYRILKFTVTFILHNLTGFEISRTSKSLPRSPFKKTQVISQLILSLSPNSKDRSSICIFSKKNWNLFKTTINFYRKEGHCKMISSMARYQLLQM